MPLGRPHPRVHNIRMLSIFAEAAAARLIEKAYDASRDLFVRPVEDAIRDLTDNVQELADTLEQQRLEPLRSGLEFAQLDLWEEARDEFVRARGVDPYSPVAAAWLAAALLKLGDHVHAVRHIRECVQLNPFVSTMLADTILDTQLAEPEPQTIRVQVALTDIVPRAESYVKRLRRLFQPTPNVAVQVLTGSAGFPVIQWLETVHDLRRKSHKYITAFDLRTRAPRWTIKANDCILLLVTPRLIALRDSISGRIHLRDSDNGSSFRQLETVSSEYFRIAYHPVADAVADTMERFHTSAVSPDSADALSRTPAEPDQMSAFHEGRVFQEQLTVQILAVQQLLITATNFWEHRHIQSGASAMANLLPACELVCDARVEWQYSEMRGRPNSSQKLPRPGAGPAA